MVKLLLTTCAAGLLSVTAQAQTAPAAPAGNRTAGTTASPVDPTSTTEQAVSGVTGHGSSREMKSNTTGNRTAGTTDNPVDPTSNMAGRARSTNKAPRKTYKVKTRVAN